MHPQEQQVPEGEEEEICPHPNQGCPIQNIRISANGMFAAKYCFMRYCRFSFHLILMQIFDFSRRCFSKMLIGFTLSSLELAAGATNQFWGSFERSESRYCLRILIFKEILNKISLNLSFKLGTFCKFLQQCE